MSEFSASATCSNISDSELEFVNALRENLVFQQVAEPTRQHGSHTPHMLDLIITLDNFISDTDYLSSLGMSGHSVLKFSLQMYVDKKPLSDDKLNM